MEWTGQEHIRDCYIILFFLYPLLSITQRNPDMWKNTINKKKYIGSAKNLRKRFYDYYSLKYLIYGTSYIKRAILNYGYANFSLEILEYCEISELRTKEKYYFDLLSPEYNLAKDPTSPMLERKHSEDTLTKMSASRKGFKHSSETLAKMSATQKIS